MAASICDKRPRDRHQRPRPQRNPRTFLKLKVPHPSWRGKDGAQIPLGVPSQKKLRKEGRGREDVGLGACRVHEGGGFRWHRRAAG